MRLSWFFTINLHLYPQLDVVDTLMSKVALLVLVGCYARDD